MIHSIFLLESLISHFFFPFLTQLDWLVGVVLHLKAKSSLHILHIIIILFCLLSLIQLDWLVRVHPKAELKCSSKEPGEKFAVPTGI